MHWNASGSRTTAWCPITRHFAVVVFRRAIEVDGSADPEATIEQIFQSHGWGGLWRNGVYFFVHYHSRMPKRSGARPNTVADTRKTSLAPAAAALVRGAGETSVARDGLRSRK